MRELNTIQKVEKLNRVFAADEKGSGNANHLYGIQTMNPTDKERGACFATIQFQNGARNEIGSERGVLDTDLLEIVRDRLKGFQSGDFATEDNYKALEHIEIALMYMNKRVMDRYERSVLGTYNK